MSVTTGVHDGGRRRHGPRRWATVVRLVVVALSLALVALVATGIASPPAGPERVAAQARWLDGQLADGAGLRMQELFPEGDVFTAALTGIAAARAARQGADDPAGLVAIARRALTEVDAERNTRLFEAVTAPPLGVFYRGWRLQLLADIAGATSADADLQTMRRERDVLVAAFAASPSGLLPSYAGGYWPCDNLVAMAAVVRASTLLGDDDVAALGHRLVDPLLPYRDPATTLLPHRTDATGRSLEGPRATSQSLIQTALPVVAPDLAPQAWLAYRSAFVTREAGLVGVREFPSGTKGSGDVDSGPLILGVSLSATVVTVAAARANGDTGQSATLDQEAEVLGLPLEWRGERRYALGALPIGDAWLAWARSEPVGPGRPSDVTWWWGPWAVAALLPGLIAALWELRARRRAGGPGRGARPDADLVVREGG